MTGINRTSLTPYAKFMQDPDPAGARKFAAKLWHENGTIILLPDSLRRLDSLDRDLLHAIAAKIYGKRND